VPNADHYDVEERIPQELVAKMAQRGYLGALLPEGYGGRGMDMLTFGLLCEQVARGSCSVQSLVTVQNMVGHTVQRWGNQAQKDYWLGKLASGEVLAGFALTEANAGSDARSVETTATVEGDACVLTGNKKWISFGQLADLFLVLAQCEGEPCTFIVGRDAPGLSIAPLSGLLGLRASMLAELSLRECPVPRRDLVGGLGSGFFPVILSALNIGRYGVAWGCVGLAQACLDACIAHTHSRWQFGVQLKEHQLIQRMIADMSVNVRAARLLCYQAGCSMGEGGPESIADVLMAKYFASTMAVRVASDAVQIHGAMGCSGDGPIQRYFRDAKVMEIIEGTTQMHQLQIAKHAFRAQSRG
jgi:alkylation response protein AidB-like acyl-CoA dehydrogenase